MFIRSSTRYDLRYYLFKFFILEMIYTHDMYATGTLEGPGRISWDSFFPSQDSASS